MGDLCKRVEKINRAPWLTLNNFELSQWLGSVGQILSKNQKQSLAQNKSFFPVNEPQKDVLHALGRFKRFPLEFQLQIMVTERVSPDGNVTVSTLMFIPSVLDAGNLLVCRAGNSGIPDSMMEDAWKLEIHCKYLEGLGMWHSQSGANGVNRF